MGDAGPAFVTEVNDVHADQDARDADHHEDAANSARHGPPSNASTSGGEKSRAHHSMHHHGKAARLEEERLEWMLVEDFKCPGVPAKADLGSLLGPVTDSYKFTSLKAKSNWRRQFAKRTPRRFVEVAYWWTFMDYVVLQLHASKMLARVDRAAVLRARSRLYDELATLYFTLRVGMHPKTRDSFLNHFDDAVAQTVFMAFCTAYPGSKGHFDASFKLYLSQTVARWIHGSSAPAKPDLAHWGSEGAGNQRRASMRRLMFGNDGASPEESDPLALVASGAPNSAGALDAGHLALVQFEQKLEEAGPTAQSFVNVETSTVHAPVEYAHSPLIDRFLDMNGSGGDIADRKLTFRMTQSRRVYRLRPVSELQDDVAARPKLLTSVFNDDNDGDESPAESKEAKDEDSEVLAARKARETYRDVLRKTEEKRHCLLAKHKSRQRKLASELNQVKAQARAQQQELDANKRLAIKNDIHQLSNYLVSMWKIQDE